MRRRICVLGAGCILSGCAPAPPPPALNVDSAVRDGLCLAQNNGGSVEVVPLQGPRRENRIPTKAYESGLSVGRISPDGTYVVAERLLVGTTGERVLAAVALDGRQLWQLKIALSGVPTFSPDGKWLAFASNGELTLYDISTAQLTKLGIAGVNPSWAPEGDRFAYHDRLDPYDENASVYIYDLSGKTSLKIGQGAQPSWLPDGQRIAVRVGSGRVDVVDLQTRERRQFLVGAGVTIPRWSPDGRWMTYAQRRYVPWWRFEESVAEPKDIVVRDTWTGAESSVGRFNKGNPGDYTWIVNRALCGD